MTTIRDVARAAGASTASVSAVMSGGGGGKIRVGSATAEKIRAAALDLGYRPNPLARGLVTGRTGIVGLQLPGGSSFGACGSYSVDLLAGVIEELEAAGLDLLLQTRLDGPLQLTLARAPVDGLLLVAPATDSPALHFCRQRSMAAVTILAPPGLAAPSVSVDGVALAGRITGAFIQHGHHRIGWLTGDPRLHLTRELQEGHHATLEQCSETPGAGLMVQAVTRREGFQAAESMLRLPEEIRPAALFAQHDAAALGARDAALQAGLRLPRDLMLIAGEGGRTVRESSAGLGYARLPLAAMGAHAADLLARMLRGERPDPRPVQLPVDILLPGAEGRVWSGV